MCVPSLPSDFDAIEELHGGLGALKLPPPQPTSHDYGAYLRQQREQREACKNLISLCLYDCVLYSYIQCRGNNNSNKVESEHILWVQRWVMNTLYI